MWTELGIGGSALTLVGLGMKQLHKKLSCKQDVTLCKEKHKHVDEKLEAGDEKFKQIITQQVLLIKYNDSYI